MSCWYPSPERFDISYDDGGQAYVTLNGKRFGVASTSLDLDYERPYYNDDYRTLGYRSRFCFNLIELHEPTPPKKPKRSWATSMGLRRPS
ncbi:Uncharacterised protein [Mycobacteroides abscessus subsp. bolletii]|nr:Uncharacterised protein [Mycobacteroides abscessus subsp. bolletii]SHS17677.1 Uncharacterised protein [Mycobacteroides abscessus subsp. bolletii]SHS87615.1 Uncharacterised protein [Mycobacteroides abscessus subsp. bolletii]SKF65553.1 Uncharacterised protein [Mycobacteroides abscessus subsp. bolletii]SKG31412.1 Uncharacterised protein [Mycobacteroides abscessus subsp. bolletii]